MNCNDGIVCGTKEDHCGVGGKGGGVGGGCVGRVVFQIYD